MNVPEATSSICRDWASLKSCEGSSCKRAESWSREGNSAAKKKLSCECFLDQSRLMKLIHTANEHLGFLVFFFWFYVCFNIVFLQVNKWFKNTRYMALRNRKVNRYYLLHSHIWTLSGCLQRLNFLQGDWSFGCHCLYMIDWERETTWGF